MTAAILPLSCRHLAHHASESEGANRPKSPPIAETRMNLKCLAFAVAISGGLFTVVNPGLAQSWTGRLHSFQTLWSSTACSSDGTKLVAVALGGGIMTSTNSG